MRSGEDGTNPANWHWASLRAIVATDLERAERLIIERQRGLDPRWRIATPEGDYTIVVAAPDGETIRRRELHKVSLFMAWKRAYGFTFAFEMDSPDAVACVAVTRDDAACCLSSINRPAARPWTMEMFEWEVWLKHEEIDRRILDALPRAERPLSAEDLQIIEEWFGPSGRFPSSVPHG